MTPKEFKESHNCYLTVGELKKHLEEYPDDALIVSQRVKDIYYEGVNISGMTGTLPDGTYGIFPPGSKTEGWQTLKKPDPDNSEIDNEYSPVWGVTRYGDGNDIVYLDLHY